MSIASSFSFSSSTHAGLLTEEDGRKNVSTELKGESSDGSPIAFFGPIPFRPQNCKKTLKIFEFQNCDSTFFKIRRKKKLHEEKNN